MAGKTYVGDMGTIIKLRTKVDLTDAQAMAIRVKVPGNGEKQWPAEVDGPASGGVLQYTITSGDLSVAGEYKVAALVSFTDGSRYTGETATFTVYEIFS